MSEIEKMYENAGVKPIDIAEYGSTYIPKKIEINGKPYPPFTAEKQIELIKWLTKNTYRNYLMIRYNFTNYYWQIECNMSDSNKTNKFSECIASIVNSLWQSLTEEERQQIKEILE